MAEVALSPSVMTQATGDGRVGQRTERLVASAAAVIVFAIAASAAAAPEWVDRGLTMRQFGVSIDVGLGLAHDEVAAVTGAGVNIEGAFGILDNLEIGLRTGIRFGDDLVKPLQADQYGRLFDLETYGTGADLFANPELRLLGRVLDLSVFELGVEGRVYIPFEDGTRFSFMVGLPMRFHVARILRIDTGIYMPVIFYRNANGGTSNAVSVNAPLEFWFQVTRHLFLGPLLEFRVNNDNLPFDADHEAGVLLGFGLGYQISRFADFKTSFLLPRLNGDYGPNYPGPDFAFGIGLGLHFD
jgi:hypothetical protein